MFAVQFHTRGRRRKNAKRLDATADFQFLPRHPDPGKIVKAYALIGIGLVDDLTGARARVWSATASSRLGVARARLLIIRAARLHRDAEPNAEPKNDQSPKPHKSNLRHEIAAHLSECFQCCVFMNRFVNPTRQ